LVIGKSFWKDLKSQKYSSCDSVHLSTLNQKSLSYVCGSKSEYDNSIAYHGAPKIKANGNRERLW